MNMTLNSGLKTIPVWVVLEAQVLAWRWNLQSVCGDRSQDYSIQYKFMISDGDSVV